MTYPELRVKESDNDPNVIPVHIITISGGTVTRTGPNSVTIRVDSGAGASGAPTDGEYLTYSANASLSAERVIAASDNIVIVSSGTSFLISAITNGASSGPVYAATGNAYVVTDFASDLTGEFRLVQSGNSVTIDTTGNLIIINAVTNAAASNIVYATTGDTFLVYSASTSLTSERIIAASDNITIVSSGTSFLISATTNELITYAATGNTYLVTDLASDLTNEFRLVQSGNSTTVNTAGNLIIINAITSAPVQAGSGLTLTGSTFTVNTNVRDKSLGFFYAGSLSTLMAATSAMFYIPFNMELLEVRLAVSNSAGGQNIQVQPILWNAALQANSSLFAEANRPRIITNNLVGSNGTLGSNVLHAGSWLGCHVDSVGTTVIGSNLTVNFIMRTS